MRLFVDRGAAAPGLPDELADPPRLVAPAQAGGVLPGEQPNAGAVARYRLLADAARHARRHGSRQRRVDLRQRSSQVRSPLVAQHRLTRDEFYERAARLDEAALRKALWTLYWRGSAQLRERIEAQLDPQDEARRRARAQQPPDPELVLRQVRDFVDLARRGSYLAGDRRVSPTERSRWRMTFRSLAKDAQAALRHEDVDTAAIAVELLVDLACETRERDLFRSEDPMQAAGFVASDAVAMLWSRLRDRHGFPGFAERAAPQLLRWEAPYGWTRYGFGSVAEKETTLAQVLSGMLQIPDHWESFASHYLAALDAAAAGSARSAPGRGRSRARDAEDRADSLADWHLLLLDQLQGTDGAELLDRLADHPALAGPERDHVAAVLAHQRGDIAQARKLIGRCLAKRPGDTRFQETARSFDTG